MPEVNQVHVDTALTNVSVAYKNSDFIADVIAPPVAVRKQSDKYFIYDPQHEGLRSTADQRAPGAEASEVNFALSTDSYYCEDHALSSTVPDEERENADPVIQPDIDRTEFLSEKIALNREIQLEKLLRTSAGVPEISLAGGDSWTIPENDPLPYFQQARQSVASGCFRRANTVVLPFEVYDVLRNHPKVIERIKYSSLGVLDEQLLAQLIDVDRVVIARAFKNTSAKGQAADVSSVWGANVYVMHVPQRAALKQVAAAYTFSWSGVSGSVSGSVVERWREPRRKADMIRVQKYYDQKLIATGAIYRILNAVS